MHPAATIVRAPSAGTAPTVHNHVRLHRCTDTPVPDYCPNLPAIGMTGVNNATSNYTIGHNGTYGTDIAINCIKNYYFK
jgi:hypothetical protein